MDSLIKILEDFFMEFLHCDRKKANFLTNILLDRFEFLNLEIRQKE